MDWTLIGVNLFGGLLIISANIYGWYKLMGESINFKNIKVYVALLILVAIGTIINVFCPAYLKLLLMMMLLLVINYLFVTRNLEKCVATVIIVQAFTIIAELIVALCISLFLGSETEIFIESILGMICMNIGVAAILFLLLNIKMINKLYIKLLNLFSSMRKNKLILFSIVTIILEFVFMVMGHMHIPKLIVLLICSLLILIYVAVIIRLIYINERFTKISNKYATSLSSLREHETMMDKYRVTNHENKNQLLIIRNMIKSNDKTTINYIDKLIDNKSKDNEGIFKKTEKIPEGGLRSIIYSKLCKMKEMKIKYVLDISRDVKTSDLINLDDGTMLNICKIMGVFLDNSIEEVEKLKKQIITVELYNMDGYLCIDISNNYSGNLAIDKIGNKGYTTKGKGHGYGLSLVDEIIRSDSSLENEKEICRDMFTQRLKIKM